MPAVHTGYLHADCFHRVMTRFFLGRTRPSRSGLLCAWRGEIFDAVKSYPRESHQVLEWIRQLYDHRRSAARGPPRRRLQLRIAEAIPVLDKIEAYLTGLARTVLPKSSLAKAVNYARINGRHLRRYTEDGRLTIDNNVSERTLRHQAIGRRTGSFWAVKPRVRGRQCYARILAGAKRHRIEPWCYVRDLLLRLHADDPRLDEMLPDRWPRRTPRPSSPIGSTSPEPRRLAPEHVGLIAAPTATDPLPTVRHHGQGWRLRLRRIGETDCAEAAESISRSVG